MGCLRFGSSMALINDSIKEIKVRCVYKGYCR
jgi:hypothetical protein